MIFTFNLQSPPYTLPPKSVTDDSYSAIVYITLKLHCAFVNSTKTRRDDIHILDCAVHILHRSYFAIVYIKLKLDCAFVQSYYYK